MISSVNCLLKSHTTMDHSRLQALSPIPPMKNSSFDFSPNAFITSSSNSKGQSTSTPENLNISISHLSPIKRPSPSEQQMDLPNSSMDDINIDSFNARMEAVSSEEDNDDPFNRTNVNDRRLSVSTMLDDLGLKQYESLMKEIDLVSFLMLTDDDFKELGVTDADHRKILKNATKALCEI